MTDRLITIPASDCGVADAFRSFTGKPPRTAAEIAEADARQACIRLADLIHRSEYRQANRERETIIREGQREGESYEDFHRRLNGPFCRAAERVNRRMAEIDRRKAA